PAGASVGLGVEGPAAVAVLAGGSPAFWAGGEQAARAAVTPSTVANFAPNSPSCIAIAPVLVSANRHRRLRPRQGAPAVRPRRTSESRKWRSSPASAMQVARTRGKL